MKTILLVLAIYSYGEPNSMPTVIGAYETVAQCNEQLAKSGYQFEDGYELGNTVTKETADESIVLFCVDGNGKS